MRDCERDPGEQGIEGVSITLQWFNQATGEYEAVASTLTDANGQYEFGLEHNLMPGTYRVVGIPPTGYMNVGARPGNINSRNNVGEVLLGRPWRNPTLSPKSKSVEAAKTPFNTTFVKSDPPVSADMSGMTPMTTVSLMRMKVELQMCKF